MEITYIGNGSSGNATYFSDGPTSLLIDNGLALKRVPFEVNGGVLISHMHSDHMDGVEKYVKKYHAKTGIRAIVDRSFCAELKINEQYLQYQDFTKRFKVGTIEVEPL
jgi:phosphoribosyl 1,2-cyclic phosphodiesterase